MTTRQRSNRNEDETSLNEKEALILFRKARGWEYTGGFGSSHYATNIGDKIPLSLRLTTFNGGEAEIWTDYGGGHQERRIFNYWCPSSGNNRDPFYLFLMKVSRDVDAREYRKEIRVRKNLVASIREELRK